MKYTLTTSSTGAITLTPFAQFTPPLGLVLPAMQDTSVAVPSGKTLGTLFSATSPTLPAGTQVIAGTNIYVYTGSSWMDTSTYTNADTTAITGTVLIRNNAAYDVGITW